MSDLTLRVDNNGKFFILDNLSNEHRRNDWIK